MSISLVVFSPTGSTKKVLSIMADAVSEPVSEFDVTVASCDCQFNEGDLVIFGVPVYGGRVPEIALKRFSDVKGNNTPAVLIAVYGNREYEDALLELKEHVSNLGFLPIAAAAFIAEHSIMHSVATGRPDAQDENKIMKFMQDVVQKVKNSEILSEISVSGNIPYKERGSIMLKPSVSKKCTNCEICVDNCPVGAIDEHDPSKTDKDVCISCMRCIKVCPVGARSLNTSMLFVAETAFRSKFSARKEPEIFK